MKERERLIELLLQDEAITEYNTEVSRLRAEHKADILLANGVIVPPCKPIAVMTDGTEFNTDVYCPYCGTNLSGLYGEEPPNIISCYVCGEYLDDTKSITKAEAEKALALLYERGVNKCKSRLRRSFRADTSRQSKQSLRKRKRKSTTVYTKPSVR